MPQLKEGRHDAELDRVLLLVARAATPMSAPLEFGCIATPSTAAVSRTAMPSGKPHGASGGCRSELVPFDVLVRDRRMS